MSNSTKSMAVIGAGTMGSGIALVAAQAGLRVWQVDTKPEQLDRAKSYHRKTLDRAVEKQRTTRADADAALA
ncbi:3-hydroxybutyryl-CoA dehydrogenase, partial [bacterium]|nr:3-hydroxybutyryl-CoA dehydrogenase [bacterium]